jgi:pyruvate dehydrogenase E2 component (dihydrolipoamide acetyltransferase)
VTDVFEFRLPDLGEGVAEGEVVVWRVAPGDRVAEDDVLAEVETDKALVEVPSPRAGVVTELCAAEGDVLPVGEVLVRIEEDAASTAEGDDEATDSGREPAGADAPAPDEAERPNQPVPAPPSVRRLAREREVDLAAVEGSGPGGRVTAADVESAARERRGATAGSATRRSGEERAAERGASGPRDGAGSDDGATRGARADGTDGAGETEQAAQSDDGATHGPRAAGASETGDDETTEPPEQAPAGDPEPRERTLATPATRRVADELGVDLDRVPASETRDGEAYVTEADVRAHAGRETETSDDDAGLDRSSRAEPRTTEAAATAVEAAAAALGERVEAADAAGTATGAEAADPGRERPRGDAGSAPSAGDLSGERVPYRGVRRSVGERMARSKRTVPHATHHDSVDASRLVEVREALAADLDVRPTYTAFVVRAVVDGLRAFPSLNARLDEEREEIVYRDEYNVGVAVATDAGLVVPVVEDADELDLPGLARAVADLAERARDRSVTVEELRGGTFTLSNVGVFGGEYATPIVNHPEVAVLALGALRQRPRVVDGEVVARATLPLSLSIDHRVVDGATAAQFTNHVMDRLREPARLLL